MRSGALVRITGTEPLAEFDLRSLKILRDSDIDKRGGGNKPIGPPVCCKLGKYIFLQGNWPAWTNRVQDPGMKHVHPRIDESGKLAGRLDRVLFEKAGNSASAIETKRSIALRIVHPDGCQSCPCFAPAVKADKILQTEVDQGVTIDDDYAFPPNQW